MGLFSGKHEPPKGRDPRPKGAQKGVVYRDHESDFSWHLGKKTHSPWAKSGERNLKKNGK